MRADLLLPAVLLLLAACAGPPRSPRDELLPTPPSWPATQALIGASLNDRSAFRIEEVEESDPALTATADYDAYPTFGVAGMQPLTEGDLHLGLEGAWLFSVWAESADVATVGDTLDVDTALWLNDLSIGPYVSTAMNRPVRAFAGGGALMALGFLEVESEGSEEDPDGAAFGLGGYARAGLELRLDDGAYLGLGVRALTADLDFGGPILDADLRGVQVFLTYTTGTGAFFGRGW